ncbi:MAG: DUF2167 domain-containing protein [Kiritimatiellia bacterium]|jgi:uncharacterized membrane-anchored protein|nr:DUF2167 domain-containing protein [Kiritimatiellia bacterium]
MFTPFNSTHRCLIATLLTLAFFLSGGRPLSAQEEGESLITSIKWELGPGTGIMDKKIAEIDIPEGYMFARGKDTQRLMEAMGNIASGQEVGFLTPTNLSWFVVFEFSDVGYIKDDEKDTLDPDAMLESIREGNKQSNEYRAERGIGKLKILGWETEPRYNPDTQNLEWAIRAQDEDEGIPIINHNTRVLGRRGVMKATLVVDADALLSTLPTFRQRMASFEFGKDEKYSEFRKGDKIAKYGLSALVVGGAAAVAVKSGLLRHIWKLLVVGGAAIGAFFKKLFGRKEK